MIDVRNVSKSYGSTLAQITGATHGVQPRFQRHLGQAVLHQPAAKIDQRARINPRPLLAESECPTPTHIILAGPDGFARCSGPDDSSQPDAARIRPAQRPAGRYLAGGAGFLQGFHELLGILEEHQYRGYLTVESQTAGNPDVEIGSAVKYLKNLFA